MGVVNRMDDRGSETKPIKKERGFTLVELLVAMVISLILMGGIYSAYYTQQKSATNQEQTTEMRQDLRAGLDLMANDIRMAGFDPTHSAHAGFVTATASSVTFTYDLNGNGNTTDPNESITYSLSGTTLDRNGLVLTDNINALNFVYLDGSGNPTADLSAIRSVQITMVARSGKIDLGYKNTSSYSNQQGTQILAPQNDGYRRRMLTTTVVCRNIGLN